MCEGLIPDGDIDILKHAREVDGREDDKMQSTLKRWRTFETSLRNELVRIRSARKRRDSFKYVRGDGYTDPSVAHIAMHAYRTPSIIEGEKVLDEARWSFLEGLTVGHHFDIDFLIAYVNKLSILERWERIDALDKGRAVEEMTRYGEDKT